MAYTQHRLQRVLAVFAETKRRDKQNQLRSQRRASKYHLRRAATAQSPAYGDHFHDSDLSTEEDNGFSPPPSPRKRTNRRQKCERNQGHTAGGDNCAFITLVLTPAQARRLQLEPGKKHDDAEVKHADDLPPDPVERDLEVCQRAGAQLEQQIASGNNPHDTQLPDISTSCELSLPTPPQSCSASGSAVSIPPSSPLSCAGPESHLPSGSLSPTIDHECPGNTDSPSMTDSPIIPLDPPDEPKIGLTPDNPIVIDSPSLEVAQLEDDAMGLDSDSEVLLVETGFTATTHWAHPIDFKLCPEVAGLSCDFCSNCIFGIQGLGPRKATFVQSTSKDEWKEVENGHRAAGKAPTRMCVHCAIRRIHISMCPSHVFEPIPGLRRAADFPFQDYYRRLADLIEGRTPPTRDFKYQMCVLCTRPAFYRCSLPQKRSVTLRTLPPDQRQRGCGLHLCMRCVESVGEHEGELRKRDMDQHTDDNAGKYRQYIQYRADAEFLGPKSLLRMSYGI